MTVLSERKGLSIFNVDTQLGLPMKATIQRWGNSLAIRIPKAFAEQAKFEETTEVDIAIQGNTIVISPAPKKWTLEELLKGITPANKPKAVDWGRPVGKEVW